MSVMIEIVQFTINEKEKNPRSLGVTSLKNDISS